MSKINNKTGGFTLIELLVVIAIIGILSSIVLASLNTARQKGSDAAIESSLDQLRSQAEIYYDSNNNSYGGSGSPVDDCADSTSTVGFIGYNTQGASILSYATSTSGEAGTCFIGTGVWAIQVPLKTNNSISWCVDGSGDSKQETTSLTGTACN